MSSPNLRNMACKFSATGPEEHNGYLLPVVGFGKTGYSRS